MTAKAASSVVVRPGPQGEDRTVVNATFAFAFAAGEPALIRQRVESHTTSTVRGAGATFEASAWVTRKGAYDTQVWVIRDRADEGRWAFDFYRTTVNGCCGTEDLHRAFNQDTGRYVFSFTTDPVSVSIPNTTLKRYVSYVSSNAVASASIFGGGRWPPGAVGALTLSDDSRQIDRVLVELGDEPAWTPNVTLVEDGKTAGVGALALWQFSGEGRPENVTGFSVRLRSGTDVIVPVRNDRFDLQGALPRSRIRRVPVEQSR